LEDIKSIAYWDKLVEAYKKPSIAKSLFQLFSTLLIFSITCYAMYLAADNYYPITLLLSLFAGGLIVRLFIFQHDCGHGSFFKKKKYNDWVGRFLSVFTMTPYAQWAKEHNRHHATSGNLNHRGVGDVITMTVKEYKEAPLKKKIIYRIYRNPLFLFTIGAFGHFTIKQRFPFYKPERRSSWISVLGTDLYIVAVLGGFIYALGAVTFFKIYLPIIFVASATGTWMFYVQHQYEDTYWENNKNWNYCEAAINGSSYYHLPKFLHWLSGNIGYHHIHHLSSKIPNYNLPKCFREVPELQNANKFNLWESRKCLNVALWDEDKHKMVGFKAI